MNNDRSRKPCRPDEAGLYTEIQEVSFAMDELRLFLDTHPDSADALALFNRYGMKRSELLTQYERQYGPIYSYGVNTTGSWSWVDTPMPWEG